MQFQNYTAGRGSLGESASALFILFCGLPPCPSLYSSSTIIFEIWNKAPIYHGNTSMNQADPVPDLTELGVYQEDVHHQILAQTKPRLSWAQGYVRESQASL